nr:Gag-Pol polyprotein [Tanacetum cinerariifolium]
MGRSGRGHWYCSRVLQVHRKDADLPSQQELDLLFGPLYDEFFNAGSNPQSKQTSTNIQPTSAPSTPTYVHAEENNDNQAEEGEQLQDDKFTNPFCDPPQDVAESSSHNIDPEMCMYTLTVSITEPKNIKEVMADSAWIEAMQEELHQFDRLQVWELVDKPFGKMVIKLMWLWKNKKDADQTDEVYGAQPDGFVDPDLLEKDADHVGCIDSRKSTFGGIQFLGDKLVSWMSKKQNCTAMSSAEAEYVALSASCAQVITEYQLANMFTKALPEDRFKYLVKRIGMRCLTPAKLEVLAKESA